MTNLLIVDDEILVRVSLKTLIPWSDYGFRVVGEAQNGLEALEMMEREPCQIVLTDIRMPEMDGLELISRIKERWPDAKCLILSSYNDFELVQQALRLGAVDYILKLAWVPEELLEKCRALQAELRHEEREQDLAAFRMKRLGLASKEKLLRDLLTKHASRLELDSAVSGVEFGFRPACFQVALASIDRYEQVLEENRYESERLLSYTVANIMGELLRNDGASDLVEVGSGEFAVVSSELTPDLLAQMQEAIAAFVKVSLSFGLSRPRRDLHELHAAFGEAQAALGRRFYRGGGSIVRAADADGQEPTDPGRPRIAGDETWIKLFETRRMEELEPYLEEQYARWRSSEQLPPGTVREEWLHLLYALNQTLEPAGTDFYSVPAYRDRYPFDVIRNGETLADIYEWFCGWLRQTMDFVRQTLSGKYRPEIQAVLDILRNEYHLPLKVSDIARRVGFAENYLSVLFRKETGEKIVDTLTGIRMKKARELLKDPAYKIYEISEKIGYSDPNHFSKSFKKMEGVLPLEFRRMHLGK